MKRRARAVLGVLLAGSAVALVHGCGLAPPDGTRVEAGGDAGAEADADADADASPESDASYAADTGESGDAESLPDPHACFEGQSCGDDEHADTGCDNDGDDDGDGLFDCADPGCLGDPACCIEADRPWVEGEFSGCPSLDRCHFRTFGQETDPPGARLEGGVVLLGGRGLGEVGLYSETAVGLAGGPTVSFVASLDPGSCSPALCRQALGVALTSQRAPSAGTGVAPSVGIVLDGERREVRFYAGGRHEGSRAVSHEELTAPAGYAFEVLADGTVRFWVGLPPAPSGALDLELGTSHERADAVSTAATDLRLAAYGRFEGERAGRLDWLRLERQVCEVPSGWERASDGPVLIASGRAGRPSVVALPEGDLLAVFEQGAGLAVSTSPDGVAWSAPRPILTELPLTRYGRVARRAPALLRWAPAGEEPRFHLWSEGQAEAVAGSPTNAILHATSDDGLLWQEDPSPVVRERAPGPGASAEAREPSVVALPSGLALYFVGHDPMTGRTALFRATSRDGLRWEDWVSPLMLEGPEPGTFEVDGVRQPSVIVRREGALHLWYATRDGARSDIRHAVSGDGIRWQRLGQVLGAVQPWEGRRVLGPAALALPGTVERTERLHLWFEAGAEGQEQIGLVTRLAPTD